MNIQFCYLLEITKLFVMLVYMFLRLCYLLELAQFPGPVTVLGGSLATLGGGDVSSIQELAICY